MADEKFPALDVEQLDNFGRRCWPQARRIWQSMSKRSARVVVPRDHTELVVDEESAASN